MNKFFKVSSLYFSVLLFISGINNVAKATPFTMEGTVIADYLNLRDEPNQKSKIVSSLERNTLVNILDIDSEKKWYKVIQPSSLSTGWVSLEYLKTTIKGDVKDYKIASILGSQKEMGILQDAFKITSNSKYSYVLDGLFNISLKRYDLNNNFVNSYSLNYSWIRDKKERDYAILAVDKDMNFYTNNEKRNIITKYDINGKKIKNMEAMQNISMLVSNESDGLLYGLDKSRKMINSFDKNGNKKNDIFLAETISPKSFTIKNNNIYVLDYSEDNLYNVYYVNSFDFSLLKKYDMESEVIENISKGSILRYDENFKTFKSKSFLNNDSTKVKESNWIEFRESDIVEKGKEALYGVKENVKKVSVIGKIDTYKLKGDFVSSFSLNQKLILNSPDRHRDYGDLEVTRQMKDIFVDEENRLIIPVISKPKPKDSPSLNFYYIDTKNNNYKISEQVFINNDSTLAFSSLEKDYYYVNSRNYISILNENGVLKEYIGRVSPHKFNIPDKLSINKNRIYISDLGNYSFGEYDLNGDAIKVKYEDQGIGFFNIPDTFYSKDKILVLKTISEEEKKLGLEIYDYKLNKIFDKWLISVKDNSKIKVAINDNKEIFIFADGKFYNKNAVLYMFNEYGHLINSWSHETDFVKFYPFKSKDNTQVKDFKFLGFDQNAFIYLIHLDEKNNYKMTKIEVSTNGKGKISKTFDVDFFSEMHPNAQGKLEKKFFGNVNGEVINIFEGKTGFTYILYKENEINKLGIYDPTGTFWKEYLLTDYPNIKNFTLDEQDNLWISDEMTIKKISID